MFTRGTTPSINFDFGINLSQLDIADLYLSFSQNNTVLFEKTKDDVEFFDTYISVSLSQTETLKLKSDELLYIQSRIKLDNGECYASNIIKSYVSDVLKDGEI